MQRPGPVAQNCTCKPQGKQGYSRWRQREWCELEDASCVGWHKNYCTECVETEKGSQKCTHCKGIFWDWRQRSFASSAKEWMVILLVLTLAYSAYATYTAAEEGEASKAGFKAWFQDASKQVEDALSPFIKSYWTEIKNRADEVGVKASEVLVAGQDYATSFGQSAKATLRSLLDYVNEENDYPDAEVPVQVQDDPPKLFSELDEEVEEYGVRWFEDVRRRAALLGVSHEEFDAGLCDRGTIVSLSHLSAPQYEDQCMSTMN